MLLPLFLIIDLYFLIPGIITQIFNPILDRAIPRGIPAKESKTEMAKEHLAIVGITISEGSI